MLPSGLVYSLPSLPNAPPSYSSFTGPTLYSSQKLQNINCIIDPSQDRGGLYLGDTISIKKTQYLLQNKIQAILSCAYQSLFIHPGDTKLNIVDTKFIFASDNLTYQIDQHFEQTYQWIEKNLVGGNNVLVHCHAGVSRSAAIVIAYVMKKYGLNFEAGFEFVRRRRVRIRPNENFRARLKEYEGKIVLNQNEGGLGDRELALQKSCLRGGDYLATPGSTPVSYEKMNGGDRFSEEIEGGASIKVDPFMGRKEEVVGTTATQTSTYSISELLMKPERDPVSQKQLQSRFNDFTTQLQHQTYTLFGKDQAPRKSYPHLSPQPHPQPHYYYPPPQYYPSQHQPQYLPPPINPERTIPYRPVQTESIKSNIDKHMMKNKPKVTVVQGGLPESYKSIAGMMIGQGGNRYEDGYYKKY